MTRSTAGLLVTLALGILTTPPPVQGQQPAKVPRIGLLSPFSPSDTALWH